MDKATQEFILDIINQGRDLTLATIRPDGYPQATTVSYANDGMTIYVGIGANSQKADNIRHCNKVSLTINADYTDWNHIRGVSMAAIADFLTEPEEIEHATACMLKRFPQIAQWIGTPQAAQTVLLKVRPQIVSVLDYEKGFGHTELVQV
ncbi:pyridoxamine 5'-phosphate oxidase family protein [Noviherbaspirillum pedocola]|uniref:Pyridoxamine 5'-phosphate oxidase family protein n=1 Tax=Noviherbaspirillum pedocola TaxID=2801341 RepID=A0A934T1D7_9BURK|nr:pyridoxamine 5'-phosphate oxidase family protein [Noviherbaspirillum pedocola]MBK4738996.1 pyridoxamine 5'-phosphate oxidase family protein [Noviherbaspirillum pedocola]